MAQRTGVRKRYKGAKVDCVGENMVTLKKSAYNPNLGKVVNGTFNVPISDFEAQIGIPKVGDMV